MEILKYKYLKIVLKYRTSVNVLNYFPPLRKPGVSWFVPWEKGIFLNFPQRDNSHICLLTM